MGHPGQRDNHFVYVQLGNQLRYLVNTSQPLDGSHVDEPFIGVVVYEAHHLIAEHGLGNQIGHYQSADLAGAHNQHAVHTNPPLPESVYDHRPHKPRQAEDDDDQHRSVDEDQAGIIKWLQEERNEHHDHNAGRCAIQNDIDIIQRAFDSRLFICALQFEHYEQNYRKPGRERQVRIVRYIVSLFDSFEPLQLVAH